MIGKDSFEMEESTYKVTKIDRLRSQAMDFSRRNPLLFKPDAPRKIAFSVESRKAWEQEYKKEEYYSLLLEYRSQGEESTENISDELYELQNENRAYQSRFGKSILYLTLNELVWHTEDEENREVVSPLFLMPAQIYRNIKGSYVFTVDSEQRILNPILAEYMQQKFNLDLRMENTDSDDGYEQCMNRINFAISDHENWSVVENYAEMMICRVTNEAVWRSLFDEKLLNHEIVRGILSGSMSWQNEIPKDQNFDDMTEEEHLIEAHPIYAYAADSSQRDLIHSVNQKRAQVVTGPAGNGKSQTIANIMIEQMRRGKKVLFVAEKKTAMNVIAEKLSDFGMEQYFLMMPDGSNSMKEIRVKVENLIRSLTNHKASPDEFSNSKSLYTKAVEKLEAYASAMAEKRACGYSLEELLDRYESVKEMPLLSAQISSTGERAAEAKELVLAYQEVRKRLLQKENSYSKYMNYASFSEIQIEQNKENADEVLESFRQFKAQIDRYERMLDIEFYKTSERLEIIAMANYANILSRCPILYSKTRNENLKNRDLDFKYVYPIDFDSESKESIRKEKNDTDQIAHLQDLAEQMMSVQPDSSEYELAMDTFWERLTDDGASAQTEDEILAMAERITRTSYHPVMTESQKKNLQKKAMFKKYWSWLLENLANRPLNERKAVVKAVIRISRGQGQQILDDSVQLLKLMESFQALQKNAEVLFENTERFHEEFPDMMKIVLVEKWKAMAEDDDLTDVRLYLDIMKKAADAGIESILLQMEKKIADNEMSIEEIPDIYEKAFLVWNIESICSLDPGLRSFSYLDYDLCCKELRRNMDNVRKQYRIDVERAILSRIPNIAEGIADSSELGILQKMIRKPNTQVTAYQIFRDAPNVMLQMFPCVLMGPETVAESVPLGDSRFDLVIFDEASQLPTYKALQSISSGKGALFIGDEKQLTPTAFFEKKTMDEDGMFSSMEAILEDAIITSMPQKMLRYHYRSKYEKLMAFSNQHYYGGDIVTFPNPQITQQGIHYIPVQGGVYDRGEKRTNEREAEEVIRIIQEIYEKLPENTQETLGVITFNQEQMRLIQDKLYRIMQTDETSLGKRLDELVSVVNLEACQGQEWDKVILSMTYGRDKDGNFSQNLGPMSQKEAGNRLNVMITRAKKEMYVVTSMTPEMFDSKNGNAAESNGTVRDFLNFVCNGKLENVKAEAVQTEKHNFLADAVAEKLRGAGYTVHTQVGSSSCKVDLAIPAEDGTSYALGIMIDHYRDGKDMEDRCITIPEMLRYKGWTIYKLHAMNWYMRPDYEYRQIMDMLEKTNVEMS